MKLRPKRDVTIRNILLGATGYVGSRLNPPAAPELDTVAEERVELESILDALRHSPISKIVAEFTYGAQPSDSAGDLGTLYCMERGCRDLGRFAARWDD